MKEINQFISEKYISAAIEQEYIPVEDGIYAYKADNELVYVTSLSFIQEPEYDECEYADNISQYPLEDILDKFYCYISDFYKKLNIATSKTCYLEFASSEIDDIRQLRSIIGKHVYTKERKSDNNIYVDLIIE